MNMLHAATAQACERAARDGRAMEVHVLESDPPVWYVTCPDAGERPGDGARHVLTAYPHTRPDGSVNIATDYANAHEGRTQ